MRELTATPAFLVFVLCTWPAVAAFHTHSGDIVADTLAWYAIGAYFVFPFPAIALVRRMRARGGAAPSHVVGLFAVLPPDIPVSVEVPNDKQARALGPLEWARRALTASQAVLEAADRRRETQPR